MNMSLRGSKKVNLKSDFTRLTKIQRRGLKLWNELPVSIQNEKSRPKFKANIKSLFK